MQEHSTTPSEHYDHVTAAWRHLLGDNLHYGYFTTPTEDLSTAALNLTKKMAALARLRDGEHVLDVGCGVGAPAAWLAENVGCFVTGISTSTVGVSQATAMAADLNLGDKIQFQYGDGMHNGLPSDSFDVAWVMESSHLMPDNEALLAECRRVLRPGGRLVLCDVILRGPISETDLAQYAKELLLLERVFGEARMETLEVYAEIADRQGLKVESAQDISEETYPTLAAWRANAHRHRDDVVSLIGQQAYEDFIEACGVIERFWRMRRLGYGMLLARLP